MVLGMSTQKPFNAQGDPREQERYAKYNEEIKKSIERTSRLPFPEQIEEREREWKRLQELVETGVDSSKEDLTKTVSGRVNELINDYNEFD